MADPVFDRLKAAVYRVRELKVEGGDYFAALRRDAVGAGARAAIEADPEIRPRLGKPWNCVLGGISELRSEEVVTAFAGACMADDDATIASTFADYASVLRRGRALVDIKVGLERFQSEEKSFAVGTFTIREATQKERLANNKAQFLLAKIVELPEIEATDLAKAEALRSENATEARAVLDAVRLLSRGRLSAPWLRITGRWLGGGSMSVLSPFDAGPGTTVLRTAEARDVQKLFPKFATAPRHVHIAVRRSG